MIYKSEKEESGGIEGKCVEGKGNVVVQRAMSRFLAPTLDACSISHATWEEAPVGCCTPPFQSAGRRTA